MRRLLILRTLQFLGIYDFVFALKEYNFQSKNWFLDYLSYLLVFIGPMDSWFIINRNKTNIFFKFSSFLNMLVTLLKASLGYRLIYHMSLIYNNDYIIVQLYNMVKLKQ